MPNLFDASLTVIYAGEGRIQAEVSDE